MYITDDLKIEPRTGIIKVNRGITMDLRYESLDNLYWITILTKIIIIKLGFQYSLFNEPCFLIIIIWPLFIYHEIWPNHNEYNLGLCVIVPKFAYRNLYYII